MILKGSFFEGLGFTRVVAKDFLISSHSFCWPMIGCVDGFPQRRLHSKTEDSSL